LIKQRISGTSEDLAAEMSRPEGCVMEAQAPVGASGPIMR
jgi:hypothetical protein